MQLDLGAAWNEATRMLKGNGQLLVAVAGVFLVLPSLILSVLTAEDTANFMAEMEMMGQGVNSPDAMLATLGNFYQSMGIGLFFVALAQMLGTLAILIIFLDANRPTVGESISQAARLFIPNLLAQIIIVIAAVVIGLVLALIIGVMVAAIGETAGIAIAVLLGIILLVAAIWISFRLILTSPVIAAEKETNPITALKRSFGLTKGNSLRIFGLVLLVAIIAGILYAILAGIMGVIFTAILPTAGALVASGAVEALLSGVLSVILLAVYAAIYRQLTGGGSVGLEKTFS